MPEQSWALPAALSEHPEKAAVEKFLQRLFAEHGDQIAFVVLFGSVAKGTWTVRSDVDVFVGLSVDDGKRLIDRMAEFTAWEGNIEVFPYARSEWECMVAQKHPLLLAVLEDGIPIFDNGAFASLRELYREWRAQGLVTPTPWGWQIR